MAKTGNARTVAGGSGGNAIQMKWYWINSKLRRFALQQNVVCGWFKILIAK